MIANHPMAFTQFLGAVDFMAGPSREIIIATEDREDKDALEMVRTAQSMFLPNMLLVLHAGNEKGRLMQRLAPYLESMGPDHGKATAYVCEQYACRQPVTDPESLRAELSNKTSS